MKQVLDEAVILAVTDKYPEDTAWDNLKLYLMAASCIFAMIAQFAPLPFPESRPVLGICGSLYFVLSGALQFITTYLDKDAIVWTTPCVTYKETATPVCVRTNFPRFSEYYTVSIELVLKDDKGKLVTQPPHVTQTWSVGQFFDKEGYFHEVGIMEECKKLMTRLEAGKYDAYDDDNKEKAKLKKA
jgi:signal peptidase complex subunit 2